MKSNKSFLLKFLIVCTLLFSLLFLASCSQSEDIEGSTVQLTYPSKYASPKVVGIEVLPRSSVPEDSSFYLIVDVENQGAYDMRNARVRVFGHDQWYVEMGDSDPFTFDISGYNEDSAIILSEEIEIKGRANQLSSEEKSYRGTVFVETEFTYSTVLDQSICINPSSYDVFGGCENPELDAQIMANAQYAPVAVTSFEQNVFDRESLVYFTFHIQNKGSGTVETVYLKDYRLTLDPLENCKFKGENKEEPSDEVISYTFERGEKSVDLVCEYHFGELKSAATKALYLELLYDYRLLDDASFTIVSSR